MCLTKVAGNDSSYCSKFFYFYKNPNINRVTNKRRNFLTFFENLWENYGFCSLSSLILGFRRNKKNLEQ